MWRKTLAIIAILYFFVLLQTSFFPHFNVFGAVPDLVFILFFVIVFFEEQSLYQVILLAVAAGFFLDIFSHSYIGPSIILLIIVGLFLKKFQSMLRGRKDDHPFVYFMSLFVVFLLVYDLLLGLYLYFIDPTKIMFSFGVGTIFALLYDMLIAAVLFFVYKKSLRNLEW